MYTGNFFVITFNFQEYALTPKSNQSTQGVNFYHVEVTQENQFHLN